MAYHFTYGLNETRDRMQWKAFLDDTLLHESYDPEDIASTLATVATVERNEKDTLATKNAALQSELAVAKETIAYLLQHVALGVEILPNDQGSYDVWQGEIYHGTSLPLEDAMKLAREIHTLDASDDETVTAPADATEPPAGTGLQQGVVCGICYHSFDDPCENHPVCQDTGNPRADAPQYHFVTYTLYTNEDDADEETSPVAVWRSNAGLEAILVRAKAFANQHNTTVYVDWGDIYWDVISPDAPVCATCGDTRIIQELGEVADGEFEPHPIDCPDCVVQPLDSELDRFCVAEYGIPSLPTAKLREMLSERDNKLNNLKTVIALKPLELTVIRYFNEVRREIERREKLAAASESADA